MNVPESLEAPVEMSHYTDDDLPSVGEDLEADKLKSISDKIRLGRSSEEPTPVDASTRPTDEELLLHQNDPPLPASTDVDPENITELAEEESESPERDLASVASQMRHVQRGVSAIDDLTRKVQTYEARCSLIPGIEEQVRTVAKQQDTQSTDIDRLSQQLDNLQISINTFQTDILHAVRELSTKVHTSSAEQKPTGLSPDEPEVPESIPIAAPIGVPQPATAQPVVSAAPSAALDFSDW